jgi:hypothetical protein
LRHDDVQPSEKTESKWKTFLHTGLGRDTPRTLKFFDGFPDDTTVEKVMDNLDFSRGVRAFLSGLPGSSLVSMRTGLHPAWGLGANNTVVIFEELLDSKALWLTPRRSLSAIPDRASAHLP